MTMKKPKKPKKLILIAIFTVLCICLAVAVAASGNLPDPRPVADLPEGNVPAIEPTASPSSCIPASDAQARTIRSSIQDVAPGNGIEHLFAVRSRDFENVYMVAGSITGDGIGPGEAIGVWAISGEMDSPGMVLAVEGFAHEFSGFPLSRETNAGISMSDDGAQESYDCVATSLK